MQANEEEASSPAKLIVGEIGQLREALRETLEVYFTRLDQELMAIGERVEKQTAEPKVSTTKLRDMRDMLTLLRTAEIKSKKGRRKDIKKIDSMIGDLTMLTEKW